MIGWDHQPEMVEEVSTQHRNSRYLEGLDLHPAFTATDDLAGLPASCDVVLIALPARYVEPSLALVLAAARPDAIASSTWQWGSTSTAA